MRVTRLRASPRHGGAGGFEFFMFLIRHGGAPSGVAAFIIMDFKDTMPEKTISMVIIL